MDELDRLRQDRPWRVRIHHERVRADREDSFDTARAKRGWRPPPVGASPRRADARAGRSRSSGGPLRRPARRGPRPARPARRRRRRPTPRRPRRSRAEPIGGSVSSVARSSSEAATVRRSIVDAGGTATSPSASSVDIGSDTNTGPTGGDAASWKARRMTVPSSSRVRTSCTHFDTGRASPTRSPESSGSLTMWR